MNVNVMSDMKKNIISLYLLTNFFRATERRIYAYMRVRWKVVCVCNVMFPLIHKTAWSSNKLDTVFVMFLI